LVFARNATDVQQSQKRDKKKRVEKRKEERVKPTISAASSEEEMKNV
jgi:hypothetical protein